MPGDAIIGKVAVKVIPDTKLFKQDLEAQLDKIERTLDDVGIQIRPVLDGTTIKAEAKALKAQLERDIGTINVQFDPENQASITREIAEIQRHIDRLNETEIIPHIGMNLEDLTAAKELLHEALDSVAHIDLYVDDANPNSIKSAIAKIDAELQKMQPTVEVKLNEDELLAKREELAALLHEMDSTIDIQVDMSDTSDVKAALATLQKELKKVQAPKIGFKLDEASLTTEIAKLEAQLAQAAHVDLRFDPNDMKSVEKAIAKLDTELEALSSPIEIHLDETSLKAERARLQALLDDDIAIKVKLNTDAGNALLDDIQRKLNTISFSPKADPAAVEKAKRDVADIFIQLDSLDKKIAVEIDPIERQKTEHEIRDLQDKLNDLKAKIKADLSEPERLGVVARLQLLARDRVVKLLPEVSATAAAKAKAVLEGLSGFNLGRELLEGIENVFTNLDVLALSFAKVGSTIGIVGSAALASVSNILSLGSSLASIAPAALALPGIFGGIAVGIGTAAIALADFKKYVPEITSLWQTMRATISDNFWKVAAAPIRDMVDTLLPAFTEQMGQTATILGGFFGNLAGEVKKALGPRLASMFGNLNKSILIATGSTSSYANIIATLGDIGASYLPRLAGFFADISDKFSAFLTTAENDGRLKGWIDTGIDALKDLGGVVVGVSRVFSGLADAASEAGSATLKSLGGALNHIADTINSEPFHSKLVGVFDAAHDAIDSLVTKAGPGLTSLFSSLADTLTTVLPLIGTTLGTLVGGIADALSSPAIQQGITNLFQGVKNVVDDLTPILPKLANAIGHLGDLVGTVLTNLGPAFSTALSTISDAVDKVTPTLENLANDLGPALEDAINTLSPVVVAAVDFLGKLATALFELGQEIGDIGLILTGQWGDLDGKFEGHMKAISGTQNFWTDKMSGDLKKAVGTDEVTWDGHFAKVIGIHSDGLSKLDQMTKESYGAREKESVAHNEKMEADQIDTGNVLRNLMSGNWQGIADDLSVAWDGITGSLGSYLGMLVTGAQNELGVIRQFFSDGWAGIGADLDTAWTTVTSSLGTYLGQMSDNAQREATNIGNIMTQGWGFISTSLGPAWNGIVSGVSGYLDLMGQNAERGVGNIRQFFSNGWASIGQDISSAFSGMVGAIGTYIGQMVTEAEGIKDKILTGLSDIGSWLLASGGYLIQGLIDGLKAKAQAAVDTVKNIGGLLVSGMKSVLDINSPSRVFRAIGEGTMEGYQQGLENMYDGVKNSLLGFAGDLTDMDMGTITPSIAPAINAQAQAAGGLSGQAVPTTRVLNYYAAEGTSLSSDEELFTAAGRSRMGVW